MRPIALVKQRLRQLTRSLTLLILPQVAFAQMAQRFEVRDDPACPTCKIRVAASITLASSSLDGEISQVPFAVRVDPTGRYWVLAEGALPRVFSPAGDYLYTFGRQGEGPGEIVLAEDLFWPARDTLVILDGALRRALVFSGETTFVRQARLPAQMASARVLAWPNAVAVSGPLLNATSAGMPIHIASFSTNEVQIARSFGPDGGVLRPNYRGPTFHLLDVAPNGLLVSVSPSRFEIHRWSREGHEHSRISRRTDWFPDSGAMRIGNPNSPPTPGVTAIHVDGDGLIWVFIRQASARWREGWEGIPADVREVTRSQLDYGRLFNTRVEVIDVVRRRVIVSGLIEGIAFAAVGDGAIAVFRSDPSGEPRVSLERFQIER